MALALALSVNGGMGLGDLGYRGRELARRLADEAQLLPPAPVPRAPEPQAPAATSSTAAPPAVATAKPTEGIDSGAADKYRLALISGLRQRVETSFSGLWTRFIDRVYARSWDGLWNAIKLKLLHYNLCQAGLIPA